MGQGTGLGLSICYGVVHSWGARIEVESEPGCGTLMRIRFPLPDRKDPEQQVSR
ncbi:MAG: ATP-binding protein [Planctomycetota bacterium]